MWAQQGAILIGQRRGPWWPTCPTSSWDQAPPCLGVVVPPLDSGLSSEDNTAASFPLGYHGGTSLLSPHWESRPTISKANSVPQGLSLPDLTLRFRGDGAPDLGLRA